MNVEKEERFFSVSVSWGSLVTSCIGRWFPPPPLKLSSSFHPLNITLAVAEVLNPNKPNQASSFHPLNITLAVTEVLNPNKPNQASSFHPLNITLAVAEVLSRYIGWVMRLPKSFAAFVMTFVTEIES